MSKRYDLILTFIFFVVPISLSAAVPPAELEFESPPPLELSINNLQYEFKNSLIIDTRDQETCHRVQESLLNNSNNTINLDLEDLCVTRSDLPYVSVTFKDDVYLTNIEIPNLEPRSKELLRQTEIGRAHV